MSEQSIRESDLGLRPIHPLQIDILDIPPRWQNVPVINWNKLQPQRLRAHKDVSTMSVRSVKTAQQLPIGIDDLDVKYCQPMHIIHIKPCATVVLSTSVMLNEFLQRPVLEFHFFPVVVLA